MKRANPSCGSRALGCDKMLMTIAGTGEHGVGIGKREYLYEELGAGTVGLMKTIKRALDPHDLFNPGKVRYFVFSDLLFKVHDWPSRSCIRTIRRTTLRRGSWRARARRGRCMSARRGVEGVEVTVS